MGTWYLTYTDEVGVRVVEYGRIYTKERDGGYKDTLLKTLIFSRILMFTFTQMGTVDAGLELFLLCMQIQYFIFL